MPKCFCGWTVGDSIDSLIRRWMESFRGNGLLFIYSFSIFPNMTLILSIFTVGHHQQLPQTTWKFNLIIKVTKLFILRKIYNRHTHTDTPLMCIEMFCKAFLFIDIFWVFFSLLSFHIKFTNRDIVYLPRRDEIDLIVHPFNAGEHNNGFVGFFSLSFVVRWQFFLTYI